MDDLRFDTYLSTLGPVLTEELAALEQEALAVGVPIIRPDMQQFLKTLLAMCRPARILEIGTGIGFSAMFMAEYCSSVRELTTIENYPPRLEAARRVFASAKRKEIRLLEGEVSSILPTLEGSYDLIFQDGPKGQYGAMLPLLKTLMRPGGVLLTDNILLDGALLESRFAVRRRDRTVHKRMREYLYTLTHDPELTTTILSLGDGAAVSVKRYENESS